MALLSSCAAISDRLGFHFEVATVDHGLRAEGAIEAGKVGEASRAFGGLKHHLLRVEVPNGSGLEEKARHARYAALERIRASERLNVVATAHTANDQAETLLMRLMRGSALGGAGGIQELRADHVIRPMLFATREDVLAYLQAREIAFATDSMNADRSFLRVRVRSDVLPALDAAAGGPVVKALARFASLAAEDDAWLDEQALAALGDPSELLADKVLTLPPPIARRVVALALTAQGVEVNFEVVADVLRALRDGGTATLAGDRIFACKNGRGYVENAPPRLHATSSSTGGREGP